MQRGEHSLRLRWRPVPGARGFRLRWRPEGERWPPAGGGVRDRGRGAGEVGEVSEWAGSVSGRGCQPDPRQSAGSVNQMGGIDKGQSCRVSENEDNQLGGWIWSAGSVSEVGALVNAGLEHLSTCPGSPLSHLPQVARSSPGSWGLISAAMNWMG